MDRSPALIRPAQLRSSSFEPAGDRTPAIAPGIGLGQPHRVEDQRKNRPQRNKLDTEVRTAECEAEDQDRHIGIAARGDQAELAVDTSPDMDVHPEAAQENALDDPLGDIAKHDRPNDQQLVDPLERTPVSLQSLRPCPPPEGWMDQIEPMVEDIAPFRRLAGAARELAVDRVEHHEAKPSENAGPVPAVEEQEERGDA